MTKVEGRSGLLATGALTRQQNASACSSTYDGGLLGVLLNFTLCALCRHNSAMIVLKTVNTVEMGQADVMQLRLDGSRLAANSVTSGKTA